MAGIEHIHWTDWKEKQGKGIKGFKGRINLDRYPDIQMLGDEGLTVKEVYPKRGEVKNQIYVTYDRGYVIRFIAKKVVHPLVKGGLSREAFLTLAGEAWDEAKKDVGLTLEEIREEGLKARIKYLGERARKKRLRQENPDAWRREWQENKEKGYMRARNKGDDAE